MGEKNDIELCVGAIQTASKIITFYEKEQLSLRNAMKIFPKISKNDDVRSYSFTHALVFETVRFQNILNRMIHMEIQNQLQTNLSQNSRNVLRVVIYLLGLAPKVLEKSDFLKDPYARRAC